jgi:hypothetical protein
MKNCSEIRKNACTGTIESAKTKKGNHLCVPTFPPQSNYSRPLSSSARLLPLPLRYDNKHCSMHAVSLPYHTLLHACRTLYCSMHAYITTISLVNQLPRQLNQNQQVPYRGGRVSTSKSSRDYRRRSPSPRHRRSPSPNYHSQHQKDRKSQDFSKGAGRKVHSACAVCLG